MKNLYKQLLAVVAMAAVFTSIAPVAHAAQVTGTVNVTVNLTSACQISTPPGTVTFNYTAFGAAVNPSTTVGVSCTDTLPYNLSFTTPAVGSTVNGTLLGLNYTLSVPVGVQAGLSTGNTHTISGSMAAGQAGTCNAATCTANGVHTLYVIY